MTTYTKGEGEENAIRVSKLGFGGWTTQAEELRDGNRFREGMALGRGRITPRGSAVAAAALRSKPRRWDGSLIDPGQGNPRGALPESPLRQLGSHHLPRSMRFYYAIVSREGILPVLPSAGASSSVM